MGSLPTIHGSDLADLVNASLGGYQNALDQALLYSYLNEGKNMVWMILKELKVNYFGQTSQSTDNTQLNYFGPLATNSRQYTLPGDFHEMRFLEVEDVGWEDTRIEYRPISHPDWQDARRSNTNVDNDADLTLGDNVIYYDILGKNQLILAQYPQFPFHVTLIYIRIIPDFGADDVVDEILYPFSQKIAEYATKKAMLALQDEPMTDEWTKQWRDSVIMMTESASLRQSSDPLFVASFYGWSIED